MAPTRSSRASGADTDTSMADTSDHIRQLPVDPMVRFLLLVLVSFNGPPALPVPPYILGPASAVLTREDRRWTRRQTLQKTLTRTPIPPRAVSTVTLSIPMAGSEDLKPLYSAEVSLARSMTVLVNQRYEDLLCLGYNPPFLANAARITGG